MTCPPSLRCPSLFTCVKFFEGNSAETRIVSRALWVAWRGGGKEKVHVSSHEPRKRDGVLFLTSPSLFRRTAYGERKLGVGVRSIVYDLSLFFLSFSFLQDILLTRPSVHFFSEERYVDSSVSSVMKQNANASSCGS